MWKKGSDMRSGLEEKDSENSWWSMPLTLITGPSRSGSGHGYR